METAHGVHPVRHGIRFVVGAQNAFQCVKVCTRHVRHGGSHREPFQCDPDVEQLADLIDIHVDDDSAAVQRIGHQAFRFQLAQRLAHGDAAGLEAGRQRVLLEGRARGQGPRQNVETQLVADPMRQGLGVT
ncbi:hypothetical protein D3C72_1959590 [compost metagenome]